MIDLKRAKEIYDLVLKLRDKAQEVHDISADLLEFDGDRRGHHAALEEAEAELVDIVLQIYPDNVDE